MLNDTQVKILRLALFDNVTSLRGMSERLGIPASMVKFHRARMYRQMRVHNLAHAVAKVAFEGDMILPELIPTKRESGNPNSPMRTRWLMRRRLEMKHKLMLDVCRFICDSTSLGTYANIEVIIRKFEIVPKMAAEIVRMLEERGYIETQKDGDIFPLWRP